MKHLILITIGSIFFQIGFNQDTLNNFKIQNGEVIWQNIYETNLSPQELIKRIKSSGLLEGIEGDSLELTGQLRQLDANYKAAGYSELLTPIYIARSHINGFVVIDFKGKKYRVVLKKIVLTQIYDDGLSKQGEKSNLEDYSIKNGLFKNAFKKSPSIILNYTFTNAFSSLSNNTVQW